ncbi:hypothetical protein PCCS19_43250 [Paenibacillus sp. CCS19]|uniref:nucleotidyltransferase domain-containing protein n=1 Tax=Paenibacillus sp. CCS19 TaxID=3158387 RepID=UPI00256B409E|nr:hypothetical protein [Paenibacillus cellulosilyticus]GMK41269.1 hypothetical protein PCCS19_43250 [Paenibacillus cellulosilyticus]
MLKDKEVDWVLTGSLSFFIQSIETDVNDIDIQSDKDSILKIQNVLDDYITREVVYSESTNIRSYFGKAMIDDVMIELMGDIERCKDGVNWTAPLNIKENRIWVRYMNMDIPVLDLMYEYEVYIEFGRYEKARMILSHMEKQRMDDNLIGRRGSVSRR